MRLFVEREQRVRKGLVVVDWIIKVNRIIIFDDVTGRLEIDKDFNFKKPITQYDRDMKRRKIDNGDFL